jgi:hypothetical protein
MNRKFVNYFEDARDNANENFLSFNGDFTFDDYGMDDFSADGGMEASSAPTSQPYIINVQNTNTTTNISNVTILGAYSNISASSPAFGNSTGISISVGIANITYTEFLYQSMNKPFVVGLTYLQSSTANQVLERDKPNGNKNRGILRDLRLIFAKAGVLSSLLGRLLNPTSKTPREIIKVLSQRRGATCSPKSQLAKTALTT